MPPKFEFMFEKSNNDRHALWFLITKCIWQKLPFHAVVRPTDFCERVHQTGYQLRGSTKKEVVIPQKIFCNLAWLTNSRLM